MLWNTTTPGSAVQSKGSTVCMIGGVGSLPSKVARTKSMPAIDAMISGGVTPYSILREDGASMGKGPAEFDDGYHKKWVSVRNMGGVPDAVQRSFGGAPRSRAPGMLRQAHGPRISSASRRKA